MDHRLAAQRYLVGLKLFLQHQLDVWRLLCKRNVIWPRSKSWRDLRRHLRGRAGKFWPYEAEDLGRVLSELLFDSTRRPLSVLMGAILDDGLQVRYFVGQALVLRCCINILECRSQLAQSRPNHSVHETHQIKLPRQSPNLYCMSLEQQAISTLILWTPNV